MAKDNDQGMSELQVACVHLNEMYLELQRSGFSRREALYLVAKVLTNGSDSNG